MIAKSNYLLVIVIGLLFHLVYFFTIFDIYFKSPLVFVNRQHSLTSIEPPAQRLVLIVGDGLRADTLFRSDHKLTSPKKLNEQNEIEGGVLAPYLHSIIKTKGSYGVSHTRVPTESRPGHVAVIAGFYEDVSAVTKGWKLNPIDFDSVFNQSSTTYSFGSPDILPMFKLGAYKPERIRTFMYSEEEENFNKDPTLLDKWVFDRVDELLNAAKHNTTLDQQLRAPKLVWFFHMLGLDTAGHAFRPFRDEYKLALTHLDAGLKKLVQKLDAFYNDGKTAYLFTADHGMGNLGSHGDGHPDNTRTPVVAWGAGINGPEVLKDPPKAGENEYDPLAVGWDNLANFKRKDLLQADLAPLMASLIGVNYPMNSVGVLPIEYLDSTDKFKAESAFVNAKQVLEQYLKKHEIKQEHEIWFQPFNQLQLIYAKMVKDIEQLIKEEKFLEAEANCKQLIELSLQGLRYLQTYDWLFLRTIVTLGYLGWIVYCSLKLLQAFTNLDVAPKSKMPVHPLAGLFGIVLTIILYLQNSPINYYGYLVFPIYFWNFNLLRLPNLIFKKQINKNVMSLMLQGGFTLTCLVALVSSYFHRSVLTVMAVGGAIWPIVAYSHLLTQYNFVVLKWSLAILFLAIFPTLSVEKEESITLLTVGGFLVLVTGLWNYLHAEKLTLANIQPNLNQLKAKYGLKSYNKEDEILEVRRSLLIQLSLVILSVLQVYTSATKLQRRELVHPSIHYLGWFTIIASLSYLIVTIYAAQPKHYKFRLITIYLAFAPIYVILSISYEVIFYVAFYLTLVNWLNLELTLFTNSTDKNVDLLPDGQRSLQLIDLRPAVTFLFFINVAFFGTGNVASISSFSLEAVYRLTVVFDAFLMGALLVVKILVPFFLLAAALDLQGKQTHLPPEAAFILALSLSDYMTLQFFYLVKDYGSWLEIGTTISHFAINSLFIFFVSLLYLLSKPLVGNSVFKVLKDKTTEKVQ